MEKNFVKDFLSFGNAAIQRDYHNTKTRVKETIDGFIQLLDSIKEEKLSLVATDIVWINIFNLANNNRAIFNDQELKLEYKQIIERLLEINKNNKSDFNLSEIKNGEENSFLFESLVDNNNEDFVIFWLDFFKNNITKTSWFKRSLTKCLIKDKKNIFFDYLVKNNLIKHDTIFEDENQQKIDLINLCYMPDSFNVLIKEVEEPLQLEKNYYDNFFKHVRKEFAESGTKSSYASLNLWFENVIKKTKLTADQREKINFDYVLTLLKLGFVDEVKKLTTEDPKFSHYKPEKGKEGLLLWHEALIQGLDSFVLIPINNKQKFAPPLNKDSKNRDEICHFFNLLGHGNMVRVAKHLNYWWKYYFAHTDIKNSRDNHNNNLLSQYLSLDNIKSSQLPSDFLMKNIDQNNFFIPDFKGSGVTTSNSRRNSRRSGEWPKKILYFLQDSYGLSIKEKNNLGISALNYLFDVAAVQKNELFIDYLRDGDNASSYYYSQPSKIVWEGLKKVGDDLKNDFWDGLVALYKNMSKTKLEKRMTTTNFLNKFTENLVDIAKNCNTYPNDNFLACEELEPLFEHLSNFNSFYDSAERELKVKIANDYLKVKIAKNISKNKENKKFKL